MMIKTLFEKVELEVGKRFPVKGPKALVRFFGSNGEIEREGGDPSADADQGDVIMNIRALTPEQDAKIREAYRVN